MEKAMKKRAVVLLLRSLLLLSLGKCEVLSAATTLSTRSVQLLPSPTHKKGRAEFYRESFSPLGTQKNAAKDVGGCQRIYGYWSQKLLRKICFIKMSLIFSLLHEKCRRENKPSLTNSCYTRGNWRHYPGKSKCLDSNYHFNMRRVCYFIKAKRAFAFWGNQRITAAELPPVGAFSPGIALKPSFHCCQVFSSTRPLLLSIWVAIPIHREDFYCLPVL